MGKRVPKEKGEESHCSVGGEVKLNRRELFVGGVL